MLALFGTDFLLGRLRRLAERHKLVDCRMIERKRDFPKFPNILRRLLADVKCPACGMRPGV